MKHVTVRSLLPVAVASAVSAGLALSAGLLFAGGPADAAGSPLPVAARAGDARTGWTGAWSASPQRLTGTTFTDSTLRLLVHPNLSGSQLRIRLANTFGPADVTFDAVSVGVATSSSGASLVPGTSRRVTFAGKGSVVAASGGKVLSDPVRLPMAFGQTLAVDLYLRSSGNSDGKGTITAHTSAGQGSFAAAGDHAGETAATAFTTDLSMWYFLDGVDVVNPAAKGTVVALGDSITDGAYSAWSGNKRWTDDLAGRINRLPADRRRGVLNQGIGGNRVIAFRGDCCPESDSALARLDRDVAAQTDAEILIIADGINDLGYGATAPDLIAGLHQLAVRAHGYGQKVIGGTITPYGCDGGCLPASEEAVRQQVNTYLRTSPDFDGFADFDAAVRDPNNPARLAAAYDAGDHLHLNDAGYAAMAGAVDLRLLR